MTQTMTLRCPKCAGDMATYERSSIVLDQCRECRGIFLDRGELEKLIDAEGGAWIGPQPGVPAGAAHAAPVPVPPAGYAPMPQGRGARPQPTRYDDGGPDRAHPAPTPPSIADRSSRSPSRSMTNHE